VSGVATRPDRAGAEAFEVPLWRALAVYRIAALGYATLLVTLNFRTYAHPILSWIVIAVMAAWTAVTIYGYRRARWRRWPLLIADVVVTAICVLVSPPILGPTGLDRGIANIPVAWIASPVLAWAISGGRRRGTVAALLLGACDLINVRTFGGAAIDGPVLLLLAGIAVGHVARLAVDAQARLERATELEAATRERDRLARGIHDSVLQVLALVQRRGAELGGEAAELGRLAGEQESALRTLVGSGPAIPKDGDVDLRTVLGRYASATVSLVTPAHPVPLPGAVAEELSLAVAAALANVRQHCATGTRAWVLVETEDSTVLVTVRDDGDGIAPGRLDEAAAAGRLGVAQSIQGRIRDLGGTVAITSVPAQGTEVELRVGRGASREAAWRG
jgi:signal transduction histidine kinase